MVSSPDWAWLPSDLLDSILEKLIPITDYIRFGAVCKHWQSAASHQKEHRMKSCHKQLPMLMEITRNYKDEGRVDALFSVAQGGKLRQLNYMPYYIKNKQPFSGMTWCGSTHGWLVYDESNSVLTLLNPFTRHTITLPPLREPTDARAFIHWVKLSADPCLCPNDYEVLVRYNSIEFDSVTSLAYFRSGDDTWTQIGDESFASKVSDAVYYKGQFVALTRSELPANFTINFSSIPTTKFESHDPYSPYMISEYILESSGGDLLLVKRIEVSMTSKKCIQVFKLLHADGDMPRWVAIKSIGSDVLFLCIRSAMSVSALDFPQCVPNSLYFTDGVFNLEKTEEWIEKDTSGLYNSLLWVSPTIR
ncbi:F-box protein At2g26160-like [Rosa rugosa]|uniref:F-box protein At2g26160-like n=1 Tax=Rosa rugosa TaxID=74645 RepID=UPI002B411ACF|nr:F-box protein At2g26160-like [Rosa rugosa]